MTHDRINTAFDLLNAGEAIRSVIRYQPQATILTNTLPGYSPARARLCRCNMHLAAICRAVSLSRAARRSGKERPP